MPAAVLRGEREGSPRGRWGPLVAASGDLAKRKPMAVQEEWRKKTSSLKNGKSVWEC